MLKRQTPPHLSVSRLSPWRASIASLDPCGPQVSSSLGDADLEPRVKGLRSISQPFQADMCLPAQCFTALTRERYTKDKERMEKSRGKCRAQRGQSRVEAVYVERHPLPPTPARRAVSVGAQEKA